jgi:hypothetical protein
MVTLVDESFILKYNRRTHPRCPQKPRVSPIFAADPRYNYLKAIGSFKINLRGLTAAPALMTQLRVKITD